MTLKQILELLDAKISVNAINGRQEARAALLEVRERIVAQLERERADLPLREE